MNEAMPDAIRRHSALALKTARACASRLPKHVLRDDIEQAALIGLWEWTRKHPDETADGWLGGLKLRIRGAVQDELRRQDWLPRYTRRDHGHLRVIGLDDVDERWDEHIASPDATGQASLEVRQEFDLAMQAPLTSLDVKVIRLSYIGGHKQNEIASQLGVSEPRISLLRSRAVDKMRCQMEGDEKGLAAARRQRAAHDRRASEETRVYEVQSSGIRSVVVTATLPAEGLDLRGELARYQDWMVEQALVRANGNRAKAARMLRIERTTLVMMLKTKGQFRPKFKTLAKCRQRQER